MSSDVTLLAVSSVQCPYMQNTTSSCKAGERYLQCRFLCETNALIGVWYYYVEVDRSIPAIRTRSTPHDT